MVAIRGGVCEFKNDGKQLICLEKVKGNQGHQQAQQLSHIRWSVDVEQYSVNYNLKCVH
jgi:hypothetical protein